MQDLDLAIEVKLAKEKHNEAKIQEELNADISGYGTKWKNLLVVIYDLGCIADPYRLRQENQKHFGITMVIIKLNNYFKVNCYLLNFNDFTFSQCVYCSLITVKLTSNITRYVLS
ncbi:PD-(D/E)XK nuclease domain-containing protein [Beggiatoa alba]|uniref:PD-(D/E)XK nuclease domain-containing protein n=1 Tax=Beggiatoa alba TaxID=1022 RepID=UPI0018DED168